MNLTDIHRKMAKNVFLNIELLLNDGVKEISEYDVQFFMFNYFSKCLSNTQYHAERERQGKVDCVVYERRKPILYYEIKTYYKNIEKLKRENFDKDIDKIRNILIRKKDAHGYIFIAGNKSKFSEDVLRDFRFVSTKLWNSENKWLTYTLPNRKKVKLRPSVKERYGRSVVITWEI